MRFNRVRAIFVSFLLSFALIISGACLVYGEVGGSLVDAHSDAAAAVRAGLTDEEVIEEVTDEPVKGAEYNGYIVKLSDGAATDSTLRKMKKFSDATIGDEIAVVNKPEDALKFADAEDVEAIEPNYKITSYAFPESDPVDPYYIGANNYQWGIKYVNANAAWRAGYRGQGVNIAIMDTGIVHGHEDLNMNKIFYQYDWVDGDDSAEDDNMHGSVVGGIIAADINNYELGTSNGVGMAGITDESNLMIHKVLDRNGAGDVAYVIYALYDVLYSGDRVDVINLSLGHAGELDVENELIQKIINQGTIVVAATGNDGAESGSKRNVMSYPAGYDNVIGVGSVGKSGAVSSFSTKNKSVDVAAPGELMVGLKYGTTKGYYVNYIGEYPLDGTSFAAPVVAAAAALAKQRDTGIDSGAFLTALKRSSRDAGPAGYDTSYGNGILDINGLMNYLATAKVNVKFNANGGKVGQKSKSVWPGGKYGKLPTPTSSKKGFGGWYTKKKGGTKITNLSTVNTGSDLTLYAHWQGGTTLKDISANAGKLKPAFSYKRTSYRLTIPKSKASVKIKPAKSYKGAKMQIKVGSGKYKTKSSVTVKLKKGKQTTIYVKLAKKGLKATTYKIKVNRKK